MISKVFEELIHQQLHESESENVLEVYCVHLAYASLFEGRYDIAFSEPIPIRFGIFYL